MARIARLDDPKKKIAEFKARVAKEVDVNLGEVNEYLMSVVRAKKITVGEDGVRREEKLTEEQYDPKSGQMKERVVGHQVRVMAAKTWKEINLDKLVPDVREEKATSNDKSPVAAAIKAVAARKKAEADAKKTGKLASLNLGEGGKQA